MSHNRSKREPHKAKGLNRNERRFDDGPSPAYQNARKSSPGVNQPRREASQVEGNIIWGRFA